MVRFGSQAAALLLALAVLSSAVKGEPEEAPTKQFTLESQPLGKYTVGWCPGSEYYGKYNLTENTIITDQCACAFVSTDQDGNQLTCPPGYFCPHGNADAYECKPGFYCPGNISQPTFCCPGYYCPTPIEMYICPKDHYCRTGFVEPVECTPLSKCDEGATDATKIGPIIITVIVFIVLYVGFEIKKWHDDKVKQVIKSALVEAHEKKVVKNEKDVANVVDMKSSKVDMTKVFNIEFIGLGCTLPNGVTIMKGVTGAFRAGRTCAVMGPSGAGKTTVITLITGKFKKTAGRILINDKEEEGLMMYKKLTGFVPQEDVMHRKLTVFDNLMHSAKMRLPADMKLADIKSLVLDTIEDLGMSHVTFSIIGDESERGISGGQRKRVNIGLELVADPSVLFLDEPTSGLDSSTSYDLCKMLSEMAQAKMLNIVSVIHSPSQKAFFQFNDLLLLGKGGQTVYIGALDNSVHYFSSIGFPLPEGDNPADFFLDVTSGNVPRSGHPEFEWKDLFQLWVTYCGDALKDGDAGGHDLADIQKNMTKYTESDTKSLSLADLKSKAYDLMVDMQLWFMNRGEEVQKALQGFVDLVTMKEDPVRNTVNPFWQFVYCFQRAVKQLTRNRNGFISDQLVHFMIGVFISLVAKNLEFIGPQDNTVCDVAPLWLQSVCNKNVKDAYGSAANFLNFGIGFAGIAAAIPTFGDEKVIYWREASSGTLTLSYYLAKWIVDIVRVFFATVFFFAAFSLNYPYEGEIHKIFEVIFFPYYAAFSLGYCVSVVAPRESASLIGVVVAMLFAMKLSGTNDPTLKEIKDMEPREKWLYDIAYPRYGVEAFYVSAVGFYEHVPLGYYDYTPPDGVELFEGTKARQDAYHADGTESLWMRISNGMATVGYDLDEYSDDLMGMLRAAWIWGLIGYLLMTCKDNAKKK